MAIFLNKVACAQASTLLHEAPRRWRSKSYLEKMFEGALGLADSDSDTGGMPPDEEEDLDRQLDPNATRSRQVFEFSIRQYSHVEFTYDTIACCVSLGMLISLVFQIKYAFKYVKYTYNICNVFLKQKL